MQAVPFYFVQPVMIITETQYNSYLKNKLILRGYKEISMWKGYDDFFEGWETAIQLSWAGQYGVVNIQRRVKDTLSPESFFINHYNPEFFLILADIYSESVNV